MLVLSADEKKIIIRLRKWVQVYEYKRKLLRFEDGSEMHLKYLKMKCDNQSLLLMKLGLIDNYHPAGWYR